MTLTTINTAAAAINLPIIDNTTADATCPRCKIHGDTADLFGVRKMRRTNRIEIINQSHCRQCRREEAALKVIIADMTLHGEITDAQIKAVWTMLHSGGRAHAVTAPQGTLFTTIRALVTTGLVHAINGGWMIAHPATIRAIREARHAA